MKKEQLIDLLEKHLAGTADQPEKNELLRMIGSGVDADLVKEVIAETMAMHGPDDTADAQDVRWQQVFGNVLSVDRSPVQLMQTRKTVNLRWWAAAASILIILFSGGYFFIFRNNERSLVERKYNRSEHHAGVGEKNQLILTDGSAILLDEAADGQIAKLGSMELFKKGNQIRMEGKPTADQIEQIELSTSREGSYEMFLPDESRAWLNASSSIRFSIPFAEKQRSVELSGEAWFDVKPDPRTVFLVKTSRSLIEVMGTSFDVKAYPHSSNGSVTVEEGKVRVVVDQQKQELVKGQELRINAGGSFSVRDVSGFAVAPWRKGELIFRDEYLKDIIADLLPYYKNPVKISNPALPETRITVSLNRHAGIRETLEIICRTVGAKLSELDNGTFMIQ